MTGRMNHNPISSPTNLRFSVSNFVPSIDLEPVDHKCMYVESPEKVYVRQK